MRHQVKGYHLGRSTGQRNALRRTMIMQLFQYEKIETTLAKAKAIQPEAEKLKKKKKNSLDGSEIDQINARRRAAADLGNASGDIVKKLFDDIAPRFKNRQGGYTRILKLGPRQGDSAEMVLIELVSE